MNLYGIKDYKGKMALYLFLVSLGHEIRMCHYCFLSGFERLSAQKQLSAIESLQPHTSWSPLSHYSHSSFTLAMEPRTAGKRRLSFGQRDDSYNGGERQRLCFGSSQQPHTRQCAGTVDRRITNVTHQNVDDSFISQYLSLGVERMDLQSDQSLKNALPWTGKCGDAPVTADNCCAQVDPVRKGDFVMPAFASTVNDNIDIGTVNPVTAVVPARTSSRRCRRAFAVGRVSGLSRPGVINRSSKKSDRSGGLECFFEKMGMDQGTLRPNAVSLVSAFENVSSIGTSTVDSRTSYGESERMNETFRDSLDQVDISERETSIASSTSVVERNARIIKWLCSIKKASVDGDTEIDEGFV